jgi:pimeloyl-ACP methyl ester carboxylesterase/uncharacterized RDD family membrane protein YckC
LGEVLIPRIERLARRPVAAAARSSIDGVLAGPLPETVARSIVEHRVVERIAAEVLAASADQGRDLEQVEWLVERVLQSDALAEWVESGEVGRLVEPIAGSVLRSPAVRQTIVELAGSPEMRHALSSQTRGFGDEIADAARHRATAGDNSLESHIRKALHVTRRALPERFAGACTRGIALAVDAALANLIFLALSAGIALITSLVGSSFGSTPIRAVSAAAWLIVVTTYFVGFWSSTGQTPGMRLLGLRVVTRAGLPPSPSRSLLRLVGLALAIAPLLLGFLPVFFDSSRRALQDFLAGTLVVYDAEPPDPTIHEPSEEAAALRQPRERSRPTSAALRSSWVDVDDLRLHAIVGGGGPPVVLVHGFGISGEYMLPLARRLTSSFTTLVPDLPGQGKSDPLRGPWGIGAMADALGRWLDAVDVKQPIVVANSLGCQIVTELAVRRPEQLGPLVLVGPTVDPARRGGRRQLFDVLRNSRHEPFALWAQVARDGASIDVRPLLGAARAALEDRIEDRLPLIEQPAVVVHGSDDGFVSLEWAERAAALLPRGRLVVLEAEAHAAHYTRPDLVAAVVRELAAEKHAGVDPVESRRRVAAAHSSAFARA